MATLAHFNTAMRVPLPLPPTLRNALPDMDTLDPAPFPQPEWNDPDSVNGAIRALWKAHDHDSANEAYDRFLWAIGNNHAGTFHPVVLATLPQVRDILRDGTAWAQRAALESLIDIAGSFTPEPGHDTHLGAPVQAAVQSFVQSLRPRIAELAEGSGVASGSARELIELIDDLLELKRLPGDGDGDGGGGSDETTRE